MPEIVANFTISNLKYSWVNKLDEVKLAVNVNVRIGIRKLVYKGKLN